MHSPDLNLGHAGRLSPIHALNGRAGMRRQLAERRHGPLVLDTLEVGDVAQVEGGHMGKLAICAVVMTYAAVPAGRAPPPGANVAALPDVKVGDWWLPKNRPGKVVVTAIRDGRATMTRCDGKEVAYTSELNTLEYASPSGQTVSDEPFNPQLSSPLWPGKEWGGEVKSFIGTAQTSPYTRTAKAGPREKVTLDSR